MLSNMHHEDVEIIFRSYYEKNGKRIYARWYGLRAFPIPVKKK